eukprot:CAMPEP_0204561292 /NCGR_PEP_ID=MMETSP0661-20131031/33101_1 /ASSEMBLY_ACC=CAM_ASM_000606 /TAXON_ID=109239 /ORGANISM="Alexandrium margalefi, Strain AMGDE01CS-322" /LENGTH=379 /DNA_ID=CAMNT_0051568697 /DNA_START=39 /DNA_END=1178 /DNA_ORIENTATION=-
MALRWGILGSGRIAKDFACSMMSVEGSEVVAVASRKASPALEAFGAAFGCRTHASYEALAADTEVQCVYVATIHPTHFALAKMALEASKHVLVEKPFAMNLREAEELTALAKAKGCFLMEAMWTRFLPATLKAIDMVRQGEIGEVLSAQASVGGLWYSPEELADAPARAAAKKLGSGVLLDVGCYAIAAPYMFFRALGVRDDQVHVQASVGALDVAGCDISGVLTLSYGADGEVERTAVAHSSWRYMLPNEVVLHGTKGVLTLNSVWGADQVSVNGPAMHPGEPERLNEVTKAPYAAPAAAAEGKWSGRGDATTSWRSGMAHEIQEVQECIAAGKLESDRWPMACTLKVMGLMDASRRMMGVAYDSDACSVSLQDSASL